MMATGELENKFSLVPYRDCTFFTNFFKKTLQFNLVFTATLACTKRALFITRKGTFSPLKKSGGGGGGGHVPPVPENL